MPIAAPLLLQVHNASFASLPSVGSENSLDGRDICAIATVIHRRCGENSGRARIARDSLADQMLARPPAERWRSRPPIVENEEARGKFHWPR